MLDILEVIYKLSLWNVMVSADLLFLLYSLAIRLVYAIVLVLLHYFHTVQIFLGPITFVNRAHPHVCQISNLPFCHVQQTLAILFPCFMSLPYNKAGLHVGLATHLFNKNE
eukprot:TRINITY_DN36530_c0_g5_i1.p1 TRINITY_DN36530_c0_g5~~TRINITY_DN36530_c0_g5_i1.p1  ORF type:complete len:111 (+),score=3.73 TRINITY_DN36530_c0_g5_i1:28-360(+)